MQVEANIPPLSIHIKEICCNYFYKAKAQSETNPMMTDLLEDHSVENKHWTPGVFKMPFKIRTTNIMRWWNLPQNIDHKDDRLPKAPPWNTPPFQIQKELKELVNKEMCTERIRAITQMAIEERYQDHLHIYTDGSKMDSSTSAAIWIPELEHQDKWKFEMGEIISIMTAELYAIVKALEWVLLHGVLLINGVLRTRKKVVILTDSLSSLHALDSPSNSNHLKQINTAFRIAEILLENNFNITIQWVCSHTGLTGNDYVDGLAKQAHQLTREIKCPLGKEEVKRLIKIAKNKAWQTRYDLALENGELHIGTIKNTIGFWPWAIFKHRAMETAVTRLKIGHSELNESLNRFGQADSPLCSICNTPESVEHYLLVCRRYVLQRRKLIRALNQNGIQNINVKTILGGAKLTKEKQMYIANNLEIYIRETRRLNGVAK